MNNEVSVMAVDGGELPLGGGLLALVRPALDELEPGGMLAVLSRSSSVREDLPSWCRAEGHEYLGVEETANDLDRHLIVRGAFSVPRRPNTNNGLLKPSAGNLNAADVGNAALRPSHADPSTGFAPHGARVEPGGPVYPFSLNT
jgi:TusA-related sulfurtransferase